MGRATGTQEQGEALLSRRRGAKIAIDFDSTAWPFVDILHLHPDCPTLPDGSKLTAANWVSWDTPLEVFVDENGAPDFALMGRIMDEARTLEVMRKTGLYAGFADAIATLRAEGFEPVLLTDNSETVFATISEFLAEEGISLEMVRAKPAEKIAWCQENGASVIVDDAPHTIKLAAEAGITPVAIRHLYNAEAIAETGALAASSWTGLLPLVLSALRAGS